VRRLGQRELGLGQRLLGAAVGGVAAGETDVDRPDVGIALGVELEDLQRLLGLLRDQELAAESSPAPGSGERRARSRQSRTGPLSL
ncbi:MAG TPA: hypothetical protein VIJ61_11085, partial [Thermoanaerobaculia bacterium]